jgi:hypothetical protein
LHDHVLSTRGDALCSGWRGLVYQLVFYFPCDGGFTLTVRVGGDWYTCSCFISFVMEASLSRRLGLDASLPLETADEALWKVLWKARGGKKNLSQGILKGSYLYHR